MASTILFLFFFIWYHSFVLISTHLFKWITVHLLQFSCVRLTGLFKFRINSDKIFTYSQGLLGEGTGPSQALYLHRTKWYRKTQTYIHALSKIRTYSPNKTIHILHNTATVIIYCIFTFPYHCLYICVHYLWSLYL